MPSLALGAVQDGNHANVEQKPRLMETKWKDVLGVVNALMGRRMLRAKEVANIVHAVRRLEHVGGTDKRLDGRDFCFASHTHGLHICKWNSEPQGYGCAATRRSRNINSCAVSDSDLANEC
jgi:hypothetical protein